MHSTECHFSQIGFCFSGEGDFHILHYAQYGLDGVEKFHLRADHEYR